MRATKTISGPPHKAHDHRDDQQGQENIENNFRDTSHCRCNAGKAKYGCDQSDNQENNNPA